MIEILHERFIKTIEIIAEDKKVVSLNEGAFNGVTNLIEFQYAVPYENEMCKCCGGYVGVMEVTLDEFEYYFSLL